MINEEVKVKKILSIGFMLLIAMGVCMEVSAVEWPWVKKEEPREQKITPDMYERALSRNADLMKEMEDSIEIYKALEVANKGLVMHIRELKDEKEHLILSIGEMEKIYTNMPGLNAKAESLRRDLEMVARDRDRLQQELIVAKKEMQDLDKVIIMEVQKRMQEKKIENTGLFGALQYDKVELEEELLAFRKKFSDEAKKFKKKVKESRAEKEFLEDKILKLDHKLAKSYSVFREQKEEFDRRRSEWHSEKDVLESSNRDYKERNKKLEKRIKTQGKEIRVYQGMSEELKKELENMSKMSIVSDEEIKRLKMDKKRLVEEIQLAGHARKSAEREKQLAEKRLEEVRIEVSGERADMHYNLAVVFYNNGMYKDSEREYLKALEVNPEDAGVHYNLGVLYDDKLSDNTQAIYHYMEFLKLFPKGKRAKRVREYIFNAEQDMRVE